MGELRAAAFVLLVLPLGVFVISCAVVLAWIALVSPLLGAQRIRLMLMPERPGPRRGKARSRAPSPAE
jgi:hypothetical protein